LTIEVGDGSTDDILVYEGDQAGTLAHLFAVKHGLGDQLKGLLGE
jgi:hypothetical protein